MSMLILEYFADKMRRNEYTHFRIFCRLETK
jgi:hypothetical protein